MKESTRNCFVGLFVLLSLITAAMLMVWFGETPSWLRTGEWVLRIRGVQEVRGVSEGSPVHLSGVEIGRVTGLGFEDPQRPDRGVLITVRIKKDHSVPTLSTAKIYGATLGIGTGQINIVVPPVHHPSLPKDGSAIINGEMTSPFGNIIPEDFIGSVQRAVDQIANLAEAGKPVADNFADLISRRPVSEVSAPGAQEKGITANLSTAIERIDSMAANLNSVLGDQQAQEDVTGIISDLHDTSTELKKWVEMVSAETRRTSDNLNEGFDRTERRIEDLLVAMLTVAERLDTTAKNLSIASHALANGQGTAGMLLHDPRLYDAAVLSFERLGELIASLNRITGKIEQDGHISVGLKTPVGKIEKQFPIKKPASAARTD